MTGHLKLIIILAYGGKWSGSGPIETEDGESIMKGKTKQRWCLERRISRRKTEEGGTVQ